MTTAQERRTAISAALRQPKPVCQQAVDMALEALEALEHAGDIATLQAIVVHASAAMLRLHNAPAQPEPVNPGIISPSVVVIDAPTPEPTPLPDIPDTMGWDDDGVPCDATLRDLFDAADDIMAQPHYLDDDDTAPMPVAAPAQPRYTMAFLLGLRMPELRAIGTRYDVKARSKQALADKIMAAQQAA